MSERIKRYLKALGLILGIAGAYGLGSADTIGKAVAAIQAAGEVVDVVEEAVRPDVTTTTLPPVSQ